MSFRYCPLCVIRMFDGFRSRCCACRLWTYANASNIMSATCRCCSCVCSFCWSHSFSVIPSIHSITMHKPRPLTSSYEYTETIIGCCNWLMISNSFCSISRYTLSCLYGSLSPFSIHHLPFRLARVSRQYPPVGILSNSVKLLLTTKSDGFKNPDVGSISGISGFLRSCGNPLE